MVFPWRAALCAAPTIIALSGSAWLAYHASGQRPAATEFEDGETVVMMSPADEERMHRVALKHEAVMDLLDGRITFDDTLTRFWEVNAGSAESLANLREVGLGATDEERIIQQIVTFARVEAARYPGRYEVALAAVEHEAQSRTGLTVAQ